MKLTETNLQGFFSVLPEYEHLTTPERHALAGIGYQSASSIDLRAAFWVLIDAGFLMAPSTNGRARVAPDRQDFLKVLRALHGHPVFQAPTQPAFVAYLDEHLTSQEKHAFFDSLSTYGQYSHIIYRQITAPDWVEDFLNAQSADWEKRYLRPGLTPLFAEPGVFGTAQALIRMAADRGEPLPMRELPTFWVDLTMLSKALRATIRYGLLFVALDPATMEPIVGLWPAIARYRAQAGCPAPEPTKPAEIFEGVFLMEDITVLLIACATEPIRLRATDFRLFAKTLRDMAANIHPLPAWIDRHFDYDAEMRLEVAASYVLNYGFAEQKGTATPQLVITARGRQWLALDAGQRLRVLVDGILDRSPSVPGFESFEGAQIGAVAPQVHIQSLSKHLPDMAAEVMAVYASLAEGEFFPLSQVLAHARAAENPLLALFRKDKNMNVYISDRYLERTDVETLEAAWIHVIEEFLRIRFLPFGGVNLGTGDAGISLAITPVGRYYLGQTQEWRWSQQTESQVIVQPNFEVTFLGLAPAAEAEIGRFAERRGRRMGALFQITKKSIYAAAASGMTAEAVLKTLDQVCTREVPGNVRREIEGWFSQIRKVSIESVMLIRCPDRETAARIIGLAKADAMPITETILEYKATTPVRNALVKKLKELGMMVDIHEAATPAPKRGMMVRRRRW